jgi:hypothetical protein
MDEEFVEGDRRTRLTTFALAVVVGALGLLLHLLALPVTSMER